VDVLHLAGRVVVTGITYVRIHPSIYCT
jgi:hypothetical protein